jgi:MFS family permease
MASRDAGLISAAAMLRASAVAFVGVTLAGALTSRGYSVGRIGLLVGVGLTGASVMTAIVGAVADRVGRRRTLIAVTFLSALGYLGLALVDAFAPLLAIFFFGMVNGMGRDRGPAGSLEQAMLPETTDAAGRTWVIAYYNLGLDAAHALGALGAAIPGILAANLAIASTSAHRTAFILCGVVVLVSSVAYAALSNRVEVQARPTGGAPVTHDPETRATVRRIALLFGIDSIGGGFLSSTLVSYWFLQRYGMSESQLAVLFFTARVLNALSHLAAAWVARRIGLLNTMVFTHLPSSLLLMMAPMSPSAWLATLLFLAREALVEMDVPTRQSYVMAVVPPQSRTYASAVTNLTRTIGWAVSPAFAGFVMQHLLLGGPLLIGGVLKIGYDIALYRSFRKVKPPEEKG